MNTIKSILAKLYIDKTFLKFAVVGVINTLVGALIMFGFYNLLHFDYWISSAANYFFTSILSYFLNKHFTFESRERGFGPVWKFALNIVLCYIIAYGLARPAVGILLSGLPKELADNASMFVGMVLFVIVNYFGQRLIVFTKKDSSK